MAGTFTGYNKIRPGAYINFRAIQTQNLTIGTRGTVALPMVLPWGAVDAMITVTAEDFTSGRTQALLGIGISNPAIQPLREAFKGASTVLVYRLNSDAAAATGTILNDVTVTAAQGGTFGNSITVSSVANGDAFDFITSVGGVEVDRQTVKTVGDYVANGYVTLTGTATEAFVAFAGVTLTAGDDGLTEPTADSYTAFLNAASTRVWNVMAVPSTLTELPPVVTTYIKNLRDNVGKKRQAVVYNYPAANYEGIISVDQGYVTSSGERIEPEVFTAFAAGISAGAQIYESNTYHLIPDAVDIINPLTDSEIEDALGKGHMVISMRQDGGIVIEKDINTLTSFTSDHSYAFSKNRVIRVLDDIATQVTEIWENRFIGKVHNNDAGRMMFKSAINSYLYQLQSAEAIQNYDSETDLQVIQGPTVEDVIANMWIQPVDSMEKLYLTVEVS